MKHLFNRTFSIPALSLALVLPAFALTGNAQSASHAKREAMRMVPAQAALTSPLDANKTGPGSQFRASLSRTVLLEDGTKLPSGTMLLGTVVTDDMHVAGRSRLALRFTQADLKNGQVVPIKATIVGVYQPGNADMNDYSGVPGEEVPNNWTDKTVGVDQIGVEHGVDLHSSVSSKNSGVFVSTTQDDVKLSAGSEIALAIAPQTAGQQAANSADAIDGMRSNR